MLQTGELFLSRLAFNYPLRFSLSQNGIVHTSRTARYGTMVAIRVVEYRDDVRPTPGDDSIWFFRFANFSLTKGGRRMFPVLRVAVHGLDPETLYDFKVDFLPCDTYRWRYVSGRWQTNGKQDHASLNPDRHYGVTIKGEPYSHPKSPNYGRFWMSEIVEFKNVKLTNRPNPIKDDHVREILRSTYHSV